MKIFVEIFCDLFLGAEFFPRFFVKVNFVVLLTIVFTSTGQVLRTSPCAFFYVYVSSATQGCSTIRPSKIKQRKYSNYIFTKYGYTLY